MNQPANLENVLEQLRLEYIENSGDKLDQIDDLISKLLDFEDSNWRDVFIEFQRQVHTIKGTAGSYGFQTVTEIAHSLEDYLETSNKLGVDQLSDIQLYIDQIRWIFEAGKNPSEDVALEILRKLPNPNKSIFSDQEIRQIPVILVMPYNIQRKIFIADTSVRAIELALIHKPTIVFSNYDVSDINGVELALVFRSIAMTKSINMAILSSQKATNQQFASLPEDVKVIRKGENFSDDLAECLLDWHVFIKEARRSQSRNDRSHLRISFDGQVMIKKNGNEYLGKTMDISAGGLAVKIKDLEASEELPFERGDRVTLDVEELSSLSGSIIRTKNEEVIIRFDLDQHLEDRLLAEIMLVTNKIDRKFEGD